MLSEEQKQQLQILVQYPEYKALQSLLNEKMFELVDINNIEGRDPMEISLNTVAHRAAYKCLKDLFATIDIATQKKPIKDNTYE